MSYVIIVQTLRLEQTVDDLLAALGSDVRDTGAKHVFQLGVFGRVIEIVPIFGVQSRCKTHDTQAIIARAISQHRRRRAVAEDAVGNEHARFLIEKYRRRTHLHS